MIDRAEVLRYLRTNSKTQDEKILALVEKACGEVEKAAMPKTLYRIFDCTVENGIVTVGGAEFKSERLAENLAGCKRAVLFGATLGVGVDRLINAAAATDVALAMAYQAAAAAKIEAVCDALEEELKKSGLTLRQRYSPGYFDLDVAAQKSFLSLLELTKRIGLTLTDTCEMIPTKSVTAFIGID